MVAEVYAGLGAFKAMFDMAKGLKDINDAVVRNGAVIELQEQILSAQTAQTTLIEHVRELEEKVARFETWETEKQKYELQQVGEAGVLAFVLKPDARGTQPPHWTCTHCNSNRHASILLRLAETKTGRFVYRCPDCETEIATRNTPNWNV